EKIIAYRNTMGLFQNTDDLQKVKGIGPKKYEKLKEFICL
ncbi:MAG: helix-hairpin-helix domain-containing protein, partial [Solobacterium sp.]|nr:helix-hairpin-helix domain-containing protein [Solobacterium sp.]